MGNRVIAITPGLRPVLRTVLAGGAFLLALVGLSACANSAQDAEPEVTPQAAPAPSPAVPQIDAGVPANLETASFAMG